MRRKTRLLFITAGLAVLTAWGLVRREETTSPEVVLPAPGEELERSFNRDESHRLIADLAQGEYLDVVFDQRGVDVAIRVFEPSGELWCRVDSPNGKRGEERLEIVAKEGRYRFEIVPSGNASNGRYAVRLEARRPATARDRERARAAKLFADAEELRRQRSGPSRRRALELYGRALPLYEALGDRRARARVHFSLGRVHDRLGEKRAALDAYRSVADLLEGREDPDHLVAQSLTSSGVLHRSQGDFEAAQSAYDRALDLYRQSGFRRGEANVLNNLARLSSARGAMHEAQSLYEQALDLWRELGRPSQEVLALTNLGGILIALGDLEAALDHLIEARARLSAEADPGRLADLLERLADVYARTGRISEAEGHYLEARRLYRASADRHGEAYALASLGDLHLRSGEIDAAHRPLKTALAIFEEIGDERGQAIALKNLGRLFVERFDRDEQRPARLASEAEGHFRRALALTRKVRYLIGEAEILRGLARVAFRRGDLLTAWLRIEESLAVIEDLRHGAERLDYRTRFSAAKNDYYDFAVRVLMELDRREPKNGYDALAFDLSERARARSLLDALPRTFLRRPADPALRDRDRRLGQALNAAEQRRLELLRQGRDTAAVERRLRALLAASQKSRAEARAALGLPANLEPLRRNDIQSRLLNAETLLLQYDLGPEESYLWAVTSDAAVSFTLPGQERIASAARALHQSYARSQKRLGHVPARETAATLSELILGPVAPLLDRPRLLIAAEGALHYVPFAALPAPGKAGEPLLLHHEVVHLPSASVVAALRRGLLDRPPAPRTLAVLADPVFRGDDGRVEGAETRSEAGPREAGPREAGPREAASLERSFRGLDARLDRLPFSRHEAEAILSLVDPRETLKAFDFEASKELVESGVLKDYRLLHFATHGILHAGHPELSGLVLSLVDARGQPRDGFLRVHEIHRLDLTADLVVLNACRTALGAEVRGEGMVGLTHAFLTAGAASVLVSLWNVSDQATAELSQRFYRALVKRGRSPAEALREAQISMWQNERFRAPYYWAGFVLQGDWSSRFELK